MLADAPVALRNAYIATRQAEGADDARFHVRRDGAALVAANETRNLTGRFDAQGVALSSEGLDGRLDATSLRCGTLVTPIGPGVPVLAPEPNRVVLDRGVGAGFRLREWWVSGPLGLEQGFDVGFTAGAPACDGTLALALATPGFAPVLDGGAVRLASLDGTRAFRYADLAAVDATGRPLPAHFAIADGGVTLAVDVHGARFPIAIDPLVYVEQLQTVSTRNGDGAATDHFGYAVAVSGNTALIGARFDSLGATGSHGSAYVFVRTGSIWTYQAKLIASDAAMTDHFGTGVALDGDTALVGAPHDDVGTNVNQGSAYVFLRAGTVWTQQAKLVASDGGADDNFGTSVAVSGDRALVGAHLANLGANNDQGAAYAYLRAGTTWTQESKLVGTDPAAIDYFGYAVALSGDTALIGAYNDDITSSTNQGSVFVYIRGGSGWTLQTQLLATDRSFGDHFGFSVALSGETALVGCPDDDTGSSTNHGAAYVYVRSSTTWTQQAKLLASDKATADTFGFSVALSGDTALIGAQQDDTTPISTHGSAYTFTRTTGEWTQQAKLLAPDRLSDDQAGWAVALAGDTALVAAYLDDVGPNPDQGSVTVHVRSGGMWTVQGQLNSGESAAGDLFASAVALAGDTAVIGAPLEEVGATIDQGAAYVYVRSGGAWTQQARLTSADGAATDQFGGAVALSGDTLLIGARLDDASVANQGSAYVFLRSGSTWTQEAKLVASDGGADDNFGTAVALDGNSALIGAPDDNGPATDQGSAYVFLRSGSSWLEQAKLTATDGATNDRFGTSVALTGESVLIGAPSDDIGGNTNQGSAYAFVRSSSSWSEQAKLTADDGAANDSFGRSVALAGETALIGAPDDNGPAVDQGSAYAFMRSGTAWSQQARLTASDGAADAAFGMSVALSGESALIGAYLHDAPLANSGSAYYFVRGGVTWTEQTRLGATDRASGDQFGIAVALSGLDTLVGANFRDWAPPDVSLNEGAAYFGHIVLSLPGTGCVAAGECTSGFCSDGVCCDSACGDSATNDCTACTAALTGDVDGFCLALSAAVAPTIECRAAADVCDGAEVCAAGRSSCPGDLKLEATTVCRPTAGDCDVTETCTGADDACPFDDLLAAASICRAAAGDCDLDETCSGVDAACPSDTKASTLCRAAAGDCDLDETCSGFEDDCPADTKASTRCRAAAGDCDLVETCSGFDDDCPADSKATTECRAAAGDCDLVETCSGADDLCPTDAKSTAECRAAAGGCDLSESCDGAADACPTDLLADATTVCRAASCDFGVETHAASCAGDNLLCPDAVSVGCDLFACGVGACVTGCLVDTECALGAYCVDGACAAQFVDGTSCSEDRQCLAAHCADGFCCDTACVGQCEACGEPGSEGICSPATGAPRGVREACASDGGVCGGACDGVDPVACVFPADETECRAPSCA
ncbi:MAG: hypothetical protein EXR73_02640, partial [Myxococcales bacterium]|nr:hypothetical protein [Myxococcales bacterium]